MGKNKELGLPFGKGMEKTLIAFDVDGTLIDEDSEYYPDTRGMLIMFASQRWKNLDICVWSGGGADYAETQYRRMLKYSASMYPHIKFYSKLQHEELRKKYHKIIAIDDIQDTRLGDVNLIVRNK